MSASIPSGLPQRPGASSSSANDTRQAPEDFRRPPPPPGPSRYERPRERDGRADARERERSRERDTRGRPREWESGEVRPWEGGRGRGRGRGGGHRGHPTRPYSPVRRDPYRKPEYTPQRRSRSPPPRDHRDWSPPKDYRRNEYSPHRSQYEARRKYDDHYRHPSAPYHDSRSRG